MKDLLFKNFTSTDRRRRKLCTAETADSNGIRTTIRRHFACIVKEIPSEKINRPMPYLYVLKERDNKELTEKFFCRMKGSVVIAHKGKLMLVLFMHSLKIHMTSVSKCMHYS